MYNIMDVTEIQTNLIDKSVYICCTLDVLPSSANENTIQVTQYDTKERIECAYSVTDKCIQVIFEDEIKPNIEYLIRINNVESIINNKMSRTIRRKVVFKSNITSYINITHPSDFEKLDEVLIKFEELEENNNLANQYELQIATDSNFINKNMSTTIHDKNEIVLNDLPDNQYYVRIRAISDTSYGLWSQPITFYVASEDLNDNDNNTDNNDDDIVFEDNLKLIKIPSNNETPEKFIFLFDSELDKCISANNITITKRRL